MPFPVEKSCGTWKHGIHSDNYQQIMEKLGTCVICNSFMARPWAIFRSSGLVVFKSSSSYCIFKFWLGKVTYTMEGDNLVSVYPDHDGKGTPMRVSRRFVDDDTMHTDFSVGDLEGWVTSKRC
ncbi:uncharacterized protein LOC118432223 [Branchiostoma floridae]|uniref:Uncharacterized protein LOC118432223 n=1 Tax=Branchiostoma floridae TaxID=7739 RepID=A0A9J7MF67_BRAFL|nr:uncharacterized protein LOC118432223 [Branchiostoma floridae]